MDSSSGGWPPPALIEPGPEPVPARAAPETLGECGECGECGEFGVRAVSRGRLVGAGALVAAMAISLATGAAVALHYDRGGNTSSVPVAAIGVSASSGSLSTVISVVLSSVVSISIDGTRPGDTFSGPVPHDFSGAGIGIVLTTDGQVVTNAHVIAGATTITVTVHGQGSHTATVIGSNASLDLAVIKVDGIFGLTPATWGSDETVQVANEVIAVGNALGYGGSPTVTSGIVSASGRSIFEANGAKLTDLLQTDAPINPGNSGGPLIDMAGHVIEINTAVASGSNQSPAENIGFAIGARAVLAALPSLRAGSSAAAT